MEIKKAASPGKIAIKNFAALTPVENAVTADYTGLKTTIGTGAVICMANDVLPIDANNWYVPAWVI